MANENMIQKHEDNFLAKIAGGATPADTNVRNSKEFWLDKIADWTGGKSTDDASTKKIYYHPIAIAKGSGTNDHYIMSFVVIDNNPEAYTKDTLIAKIASFARIAPISGGYHFYGTSEYMSVGYAFTDAPGHHVLYGILTDGTYSATAGLEEAIENADSVNDNVNAIN